MSNTSVIQRTVVTRNESAREDSPNVKESTGKIETKSYGWAIMFGIALVFLIILAVITFFEIRADNVFLGAGTISLYIIGIFVIIGSIYYKIANSTSTYWWIGVLLGILLVLVAGVITYVILSRQNVTLGALVVGLFAVSIIFLIIAAIWGAYS